MAPVLALSCLQTALTFRHDAAAPVSGAAAGSVMSAPVLDVATWASLNSISAFAFPIITFGLALGGCWLVADQGGGRWFVRLSDVAAGRAREGGGMPPEVWELAERLESMAAAIAQRDRDLRENLVQRDGLLREIHHRVKNNLQVISSLLNLQQRALVDPAARAAMSDTRQRITALALIYRALYEGPDLRKVNLRDFLEDLIGQLIMNDSVRRPTIRTELSIDALDIDPDHLAPLALFAVEAITNAKKHGLTDVGGRLNVTFSIQGAKAELSISDSGRPGAAPAAVGEGVGRTLMLAFARQLGGTVSFCPGPEGGMTARLTFPTPVAASTA